MANTRQDAINEALGQLYDYGFAVEPGFAAHGPMVVEALSALGRNDAIADWLDAYKTKWRHRAAPPRLEPIDARNEAHWRAALGGRERTSDWLDLFRRALTEEPWQDVLRRWVPILIDGAAGGLNHGVIRTTHAIRAFPEDGAPSDLERDELARGLAYWAGSYRTVPGNPDRHGNLALNEALRRLPRLAPEQRGGFMAPLKGLAGYADSVEALAGVTEINDAISKHTATFARVLVAHQELRQVALIELIHAITGPAAIRTLLAYFPDGSGPWVYSRLWQVSAAIVADVAGPMPAETEPEIGAPTLGPDELVAQAVEHRDEHVIKLTDALLREDRIRPDPVYRIAAESVVPRIRPWR
jgi:hypothetical protein